ncbi:MAG: hypothetical protein JJW01_03295 [Alphaproteobacteria bacterium]|nr:hypothetical protein [Rickettsiales bacterium]
MHFYNIYSRNKEDADKFIKTIDNKDVPDSFALIDLVCVKHGFSWKYSFFYINTLYVLLKKRYLLAVILFVVSFFGDKLSIALINSTSSGSLSTVGYIGRIAIMFYMGVLGNSLTELYTTMKGGKWLGTYFARNENEALICLYQSLVNGDVTCVANGKNRNSKNLIKKINGPIDY